VSGDGLGDASAETHAADMADDSAADEALAEEALEDDARAGGDPEEA